MLPLCLLCTTNVRTSTRTSISASRSQAIFGYACKGAVKTL